MSTTPLSDHIADAPAPLTLEEHLSSPSASTTELPMLLAHLSPALLTSPVTPMLPDLPLVPIDTHPPSHAYTEPSEAEVDIGMIGHDLAMPPGFTMFEWSIPNHHNHGQKIEMPDTTHCWPHYIQFILNTTTHDHYVYATCDNLHQAKYGWVLEVAPFIGCTVPGADNVNLQVLLGNEDQCLKFDIAVNTINDKGVMADTDRLRELALQDEVLTHCKQELLDECKAWRARNAETRAQLTKARVHLCLHPYLNHTALIPNHYHPEAMCMGGVMLTMAVEDTCTRRLQWYTMPQLHDEEHPGNHPTHTPLPFPHQCRLCKQLQPKHTMWDCPSWQDCHYCKGWDHTHNTCPNPPCHDLAIWMDFFSFVIPFLPSPLFPFYHHLCLQFGLSFCDSWLLTQAVLLWLTLGHWS